MGSANSCATLPVSAIVAVLRLSSGSTAGHCHGSRYNCVVCSRSAGGETMMGESVNKGMPLVSPQIEACVRSA